MKQNKKKLIKKRKGCYGMIMALFMVLGCLPSVALADEAAPLVSGICEHHQTHDNSCGYVEGHPCEHVHTASCYTTELTCGLEENTSTMPTASGAESGHTHDQSCYKLDCPHDKGLHDSENGGCGYIEAKDCQFNCQTCSNNNHTNINNNANQNLLPQRPSLLGLQGNNSAGGTISFASSTFSFTADKVGYQVSQDVFATGNNIVPAQELGVTFHPDPSSISTSLPTRLTARLTGAGAGNFRLNSSGAESTLDNPQVELYSMATYYTGILYPVANLPAGRYTATLEVSGTGLNTITADIIFDVTGDQVTSITGVPSTATVGIPLTLTGTVNPPGTFSRTITWSIVMNGSTQSSIENGNILTALNPGTVLVKATVPNGGNAAPYQQNFLINVVNILADDPCNLNDDIRTKGIEGIKIQAAGVLPNKAIIQSLVGKQYQLQDSFDLSGTLTKGLAQITLYYDGVSSDTSAYVLHFGPNGWEKLPTKAGLGRITAYATSLSPFAVVIDRSTLLTYDDSNSGSSSSSGGSGGGGGGGRAASRTGDKTVYIPSSEGIGTWEQGIDGSWAFKKRAAGYAKNEWLRIDGVWYRFDDKGVMITGWHYDPYYKKYFYLLPSGAMVTGWKEIDGKHYYFNPVSDGTMGIMLTDAWIDGRYVGADGARVN